MHNHSMALIPCVINVARYDDDGEGVSYDIDIIAVAMHQRPVWMRRRKVWVYMGGRLGPHFHNDYDDSIARQTRYAQLARARFLEKFAH
jgi:hypothetical protein